jgi:hypothetical protein
MLACTFLLVISTALPAEEPAWVDLLAESGPELKGWTRVSIPPGGELKEKNPWSYDPASGLLTCAGEEAGHEWLRLDRPLGNFAWWVDWRFVPAEGAKGKYNSGVYARNNADGTYWHQAQTGDGSGGFLFGESKGGAGKKRLNFSDQVPAGQVKPAGEWNTFEITCSGPKMTLVVNGKKACEWDACEVAEGHIGLEAEGYRIEFRDLKLRQD